MEEKYKAVATSGKAYKLILKIKATNEYNFLVVINWVVMVRI